MSRKSASLDLWPMGSQAERISAVNESCFHSSRFEIQKHGKLCCLHKLTSRSYVATQTTVHQTSSTGCGKIKQSHKKTKISRKRQDASCCFFHQIMSRDTNRDSENFVHIFRRKQKLQLSCLNWNVRFYNWTLSSGKNNYDYHNACNDHTCTKDTKADQHFGQEDRSDLSRGPNWAVHSPCTTRHIG